MCSHVLFVPIQELEVLFLRVQVLHDLGKIDPVWPIIGGTCTNAFVVVKFLSLTVF